MDKTVATATGMKKIVCTCGFVVRSHDHKEVAYFAVAHVRDKHKQELTLDAANGMMTDARARAPSTTAPGSNRQR